MCPTDARLGAENDTHTHTFTHTHIHTHTQAHIHTHTHRHRDTRTLEQIDSQTHTNVDTDTATGTETEISIKNIKSVLSGNPIWAARGWPIAGRAASGKPRRSQRGPENTMDFKRGTADCCHEP